MTVIDVNTGKFTGTGGNLEATVTSNNLEAAEEIVRQLRLRDIGGIIVIDFIDMVLPNNRELLLRRLVECLGRDRTRHQVAEVTSLGLVQMTRKKIGTGLLEAFTTECPHCHGRGVELHEMPVESQKQPDGGTREPSPPAALRPSLAVSGEGPPQHAEPRGRGQPSSRGRARSGQLTTDTAGPGSDGRPLVVAVVGAGPSGIYAAEALSQQTDVAVQVAVIDRLPVPFGLVRYGVAPDHPSIRSIRNTLERTLEKSGVRFYGDVTIGRDLSLEELRGAVDAVIYAYGAGTDKKMGIPGEDLPGSLGAPDLVAWYTGHPDVHPDPGPQLDHQRPAVMIDSLFARATDAVVVGVGNVALDVARVLIKSADQLADTDMADGVLESLSRKKITDVHILGRRGPAYTNFTTKELRELGQIDGRRGDRQRR